MELSATIQKERPGEFSFIVQTIDCIACSPVFRRLLARIDGVLEVKGFPITNKITVVFEGAKLDRRRLAEEVTRVARKSGLGGKIIFLGW